MRFIPSRALIVIGAALALGIGGGIAIADIPSSGDGTITACMLTSSGTIRLINAEAGATCKKGEQEVEWNQQGVPGVPGEDGTDALLAPIYRTTNEQQIQNDPDVKDYETQCDTGDRVLTGITSYNAIVPGTDDINNLSVFSGPRTVSGPGDNEGWRLRVSALPPAVVGVSVSARCLDTALPLH
jgi:hypothetical protein